MNKDTSTSKSDNLSEQENKTIHSLDSMLDDSYVSDEDLDNLTSMDLGRPTYLNLAGPSLASKALDRINRLKGYKKTNNKPHVKYLPDEIVEKMEALEEEFKAEQEKEATTSDKDDSLQSENKQTQEIQENSPSLFYEKAKGTINRMNLEKNKTLEKIARNFKIFIIIIVAFAGYYTYSVYTHTTEELSIMGVQAKLPLKLDPDTTLNKVEMKGDTFSLYIVKKKDSFSSSDNIEEALNLYIKSATSNFCNVQMFSDMIKTGKKISVSLEFDDGSYHKEFSVTTCN